MGRKKRPFYRIVATDSRARRDGKYLEKIGVYNPLTEPTLVEIDRDLAFKWLEVGAQPSDTVKSLFSKQGIMFEWDLRRRGLSEEQVEAERAKWDAAQAEIRKKEEARLAMLKREEEKDSKKKPKAEAEPAAEEAQPAKTQEAETPVADTAEPVKESEESKPDTPAEEPAETEKAAQEPEPEKEENESESEKEEK